MNYSKKIYKYLGEITIRLILVAGLLGVPLTCLIFKLNYPNIAHGWLLLLFLSLLMLERAWETFYSTDENKKHKLHGDWTLPLVSIAYLLMLFGIIGEYFLLRKNLNLVITSLALIIFLSSFLIRMWGVATLKEQWAVHAVGARKIKRAFLVTSGPYKYIRHPIYLGVILEVISIPLIWNAYFVLIFVFLANIPLQILRAYYEEAATIRKLGQDYVLYKKNVSALFPFKFRINNKK